jgi:hypothetical protein
MTTRKNSTSGRTHDPVLTDLSAPCGRHFIFRDFVECGETWAATGAMGPVDNLPRQAETLEGIKRLCREVMDPLVERFGGVRLTYGFASRALTQHIHARTAPALDQHAGCELGRSGHLVCTRRGQAVDVVVADVPSQLVARWIADETPFDRLYFYGSDRPLHVSVGPDESRSIVWMHPAKGGRQVPRVVRVRDLPDG